MRDAEVLTYLPKTHPLTAAQVFGQSLLFPRLGEVLVAGPCTPGSPLELFTLPVPMPLGLPGDDGLVFESVTGVRLLTLPQDLISYARVVCTGDDRTHPRPGLGLAPARVLLPQHYKLSLQHICPYQVSQRSCGGKHPGVAVTGRQLVEAPELQEELQVA